MTRKQIKLLSNKILLSKKIIKTYEKLLSTIKDRVLYFNSKYPSEITLNEIKSIEDTIKSYKNRKIIINTCYHCDKEHSKRKEVSDIKFKNILKSLNDLHYEVWYYELNSHYLENILFYYIASFEDSELEKEINKLEAIFIG